MSNRRRFLKIALIFTRIILDFSREYRLIRSRGYAHAQKKMRPVHEKRARQLYETAIELEGMLIKLCQFFSARRDIFPEPYIRLLSTLQDQVPPVDFACIEEVLRQEYGDYHALFSSVESEPLASASLGQVHRAVLRDGRRVVLKILKPRIERIIDVDSAILFHVFRLLSHFKGIGDRTDLQDVLMEFIRVTGNELDFRREVHMAGRFREGLARFPYVKIPLMYREYCTDRVIVMEYLEGDKIYNTGSWMARNNDPVILSRRIIEIYMEQLLYLDCLHFDPHPGNILVTDDNNIILLDFGMSGEITYRMREGMGDALEGFIKRDYRAIVDVLDRMGFIRRGVNKYTLLPVMQFFFDEVLDVVKLEREAYAKLDFSPVFDDLVNIMYVQPIILPVEWAFIGKTIGVLVGIISQLNPGIRIYDEMKPYAETLLSLNKMEAARRILSDLKEHASAIYRLPVRVDNFIDDMEHGYYRIPVDYQEIINKVDEFTIFLVRLISFTVSSGSIVSSYIFFRFDKIDLSVIFFVIALIALIVSFVYKRNTLRERMRKYL